MYREGKGESDFCCMHMYVYVCICICMCGQYYVKAKFSRLYCLIAVYMTGAISSLKDSAEGEPDCVGVIHLAI